MHLNTKNTLKNNHNHTIKQVKIIKISTNHLTYNIYLNSIDNINTIRYTENINIINKPPSCLVDIKFYSIDRSQSKVCEFFPVVFVLT